MPGLIAKLLKNKSVKVPSMKGSTALIHAQLGIQTPTRKNSLTTKLHTTPSIYSDVKTTFIQPHRVATRKNTTVLMENAAIHSSPADVFQQKRVGNGLVTDTGNKLYYQRQDLNDREINMGAALGRVISSRAQKDIVGLANLAALRAKEGRWSKLVNVHGMDKKSQQQLHKALSQRGIHAQGKALKHQDNSYSATPTPLKWLTVYSPREDMPTPGNFRPKL